MKNRPLIVILVLLGLITVVTLALNLPWNADVAGQPKNTGPAQDPRQQEVQEFVGRYFSTWSNQDMDGYEACFLPNACIQFIGGKGELHTQLLPEFIESQRQHHKHANPPATEAPESTEVRFEEKLARAIVYWKLTAGPRKEYGYDHFTLVKHEGKWRIVNLVFYQTK